MQVIYLNHIIKGYPALIPLLGFKLYLKKQKKTCPFQKDTQTGCVIPVDLQGLQLIYFAEAQQRSAKADKLPGSKLTHFGLLAHTFKK